MDWLDYLKAEGFFQEMTPELQKVHTKLREGQKAFEDGLGLMQAAAAKDVQEPLPAVVVAQLVAGLAGRSTHESWLVLQWAIEATNRLHKRIRELEARLGA